MPHLRAAAGRQKEAPILRAILDYLALCPGVVSWRQNTGVLPIEGRYVRFGVTGMPDILGSVRWCYVYGRAASRCRLGCVGTHVPRPFGIEVKRPQAKRSPGQLAMATTLEAAGWLVRRVESVQDVMAALGR